MATIYASAGLYVFPRAVLLFGRLALRGAEGMLSGCGYAGSNAVRNAP
ncbi:MAG: hypothetical protein HG428_003740 [Bacteroidia bacterium]|nr:hypothetical protein [Bacteroidia bacterium]